jgi:transcriptional regulator with XRE-family HTH domain
MKRQKTVRELRADIMASRTLKARSQEDIGRKLRLNQATLSRILRGQFKRRSPAVDRVCIYANISRITSRPLTDLEVSLARITRMAPRGSAGERRALKLIRLAAEILETEPAPARRRNGRSR